MAAKAPQQQQQRKQQLDAIDKALRNVWVLAIGAALVLVGFVYFLSTITPHPLGG